MKLVAWARAVKARTRARHPVLWLFTDSARGTDPLSAAARLPPGLCGIVFRHDVAPDRAALGSALARICRARRLALVVAGDSRLAARLGAGVHLRAGRWPALPGRHSLPRHALLTSSAHGHGELARARRAGADLAFLSPAFPTASHPGAPSLGPSRWAAATRRGAPIAILALGGITGATARRLPPRLCAGAGAIGALGG